ncbi:MAG: Tad domain-containing protein, partial [Actinomycetota bacterium]|nr:Tad domain-containing protein [Actinomycetota bacterium]
MITAISMVVLLGMAAMVIDVGGLYFERAQLQNGADAAALAIAQNCATGTCGDTAATATALAGGNANDNAAAATAVVDQPAGAVTVNTSTLTAQGQHALAFAFAPILGFKTGTVGATAKASWGSPAAATVFPFTTPHCVYDQTPLGQPLWITTDASCKDSKGNVVPGGFGWLDESSPCAAVVDITAQVGSQPGKSGPPCSMTGVVNTTILIPLYETASGQGQNATYSVYGFAAFHLMDYSWPGRWTESPSADCSKCTGIKGYFTNLISLDDAK